MRSMRWTVACAVAGATLVVGACASDTAEDDDAPTDESSAVDEDTDSGDDTGSGDDDGGSGSSAVELAETFEADGWDYTLGAAEIRESDSGVGMVLDLSFEGTNNSDVDALVGTLVVSVSMEGGETENCLAPLEDATAPGDSAEIVITCSLDDIDDPSLDGAVVTIGDAVGDEVAVIELAG